MKRCPCVSSTINRWANGNERFCSLWHFLVFGPPLTAHLRFISFVKYNTYHLLKKQSIHSFSYWWVVKSPNYDCPNTAQNYDFDDMWNLGFLNPSQKLSSNYFFLILLPIIMCYKTNKRVKLYHDDIKICGIMAVQIWPKMSIFPKFWTYALR